LKKGRTEKKRKRPRRKTRRAHTPEGKKRLAGREGGDKNRKSMQTVKRERRRREV